VTDSLCINAVKTAVVAADATSVSFDILPVQEARSHQQWIAALLNRWESMEPPVSHIISIERAGPGVDGIIRNMRGQDITAHTPPLHLLFSSNKIISVGIGDGGNELGMGNIPKQVISQSIRYGEKIACITKSDHLIVCGVSNWGATGLLTALSLLRPDWKAAIVLGLNTEIEFQILKTTVKYGPAVDGIKGVQSLSVDNLSWEIHAQVLDNLIELMG
jgi:D-glutamate cyclase